MELKLYLYIFIYSMFGFCFFHLRSKYNDKEETGMRDEEKTDKPAVGMVVQWVKLPLGKL